MTGHTIRYHAKAILQPPLMHEDELIDFMVIHAQAIIDALDNSREIMEKVTTSQARGWGTPEDRRYIVTAHKAKVVLDD